MGRTVAGEQCRHGGVWFGPSLGSLVCCTRSHGSAYRGRVVAPFRKGGKNDTADAEAIAIAARQPTMRFVRSRLSISKRS